MGVAATHGTLIPVRWKLTGLLPGEKGLKAQPGLSWRFASLFLAPLPNSHFHLLCAAKAGSHVNSRPNSLLVLDSQEPRRGRQRSP